MGGSSWPGGLEDLGDGDSVDEITTEKNIDHYNVTLKISNPRTRDMVPPPHISSGGRIQRNLVAPHNSYNIEYLTTADEPEQPIAETVPSICNRKSRKNQEGGTRFCGFPKAYNIDISCNWRQESCILTCSYTSS